MFLVNYLKILGKKENSKLIYRVNVKRKKRAEEREREKHL
jgi:hypothetical protein